MSDVIMARLAALEARVSALESGGSKSPSAQSPKKSGDTLPAHTLAQAWADKRVRKVSRTWQGRDIVGMHYSELTPDECEDLAGFLDWCAAKGREDNPPRINRNGKPFYESDEFESKLLRTWAKYGASKSASAPYGRSGAGASAKHAVTPEREVFDDAATGGDAFATDDEIPFAVPFDVTTRHSRRGARWMKF